MPKIEGFVLKNPLPKKRTNSSWDVSGLVQPTIQATQPQRRPGRGEDSPAHPMNEESLAPKGQNNLGQSEDKLRTKLETNLRQSEDKLETNLGHDDSSKKKLETELRTQLETNLRQSEDKLETNLGQNAPNLGIKKSSVFLTNLVGLRRQIIDVIFSASIQSRNESTEPICIEFLAMKVMAPKASVRKTLQRLEHEGFIIRSEFKNGRGGWTKYRLPKNVFQDLLTHETWDKVETNLRQSEDKVESQLRTQLRTSPSSSSSSLYNNKTTTTGRTETSGPATEPSTTQTQIDPKWLALDISGLAEVGFTQTHLIQIARDAKLTPEIVQDSIRHFAFDLRVNGKAKELRGPALNYLMGILRKGFPYAAPENYISPEAEAMKAYLESKKADQERRKTLEDALYELEFTNWNQTLSEEEKLNLAPFGGFGGERGQQAKLSVHFRKNIWPALKNKSLRTIPAGPNVADSAVPPEVKKDLAV